MEITLDLIKKHLNIDSNFTDDDNYLMGLKDVAFAVVEKHIDQSLSKIADASGELPTPLAQAILLYIGNLYNNRESIAYTGANEIPFAYDYLLSLYKDYSKKEKNGGVF